MYIEEKKNNEKQNTQKKYEPSYHHFPPFLFFNKRFAKKIEEIIWLLEDYTFDLKIPLTPFLYFYLMFYIIFR